MTVPERRRYPRVETSNLISYFTVDKKGRKKGQGIGKTINISQSGILIETSHAIDTTDIVLLSKDLEDNTMEIPGKVIYSRKVTPGVFESGISFQGEHAENVKFRRDLIRVFHFRNLLSHKPSEKSQIKL